MTVEDVATVVARLTGMRWPHVALPGTDGHAWSLSTLDEPAVVYLYPRTAGPDGAPLVPGWAAIPGAMGCTAESCGFRDHYRAISTLGVHVFGLSTQDSDYQSEMVRRLGLPFPVLSDADLTVTRLLGLPTFEVAGHTLLRRLTAYVHEGTLRRVWFPVTDPDGHAAEVLAWLLG